MFACWFASRLQRLSELQRPLRAELRSRVCLFFVSILLSGNKILSLLFLRVGRPISSSLHESALNCNLPKVVSFSFLFPLDQLSSLPS